LKSDKYSELSTLEVCRGCGRSNLTDFLHHLTWPLHAGQGTYLEIYSPKKQYQHCPDVVVIFVTSFEAEIVCEQKVFAETGRRFISLFPEPRSLP
jgi:hypothetical protein